MTQPEPSVDLAGRFDAVRLINLGFRTDRLAEAAVELAPLGMPLGVQAIRFEAARPADAGAFPTIGARGCFLSHLGVLRDAASTGAETLLLLEDDVGFDRAERAAMPAVLDALAARDWSIFYGGSPIVGTAEEGLIELPPTLELQGAHFIAFRGEALRLLVPYLEAMLTRPVDDPAGGPMHVDGAYNWFRRNHPQLRAYAAKPGIAHQRASRTDIHALHLIDRLPVVRDVVQWLRRFKRRR